MLINLFQVVDMQTQYLNSLLATASQWGLSIDSETQPYGNAGEPSRNLPFARSISFLYPSQHGPCLRLLSYQIPLCGMP